MKTQVHGQNKRKESLESITTTTLPLEVGYDRGIEGYWPRDAYYFWIHSGLIFLFVIAAMWIIGASIREEMD